MHKILIQNNIYIIHLFSNLTAQSDDYTVPNSFGVTFPAGTRGGSILCTNPVAMVDDDDAEGPEHFIVYADTETECLRHNPRPIIVTILDDDTTGKETELLNFQED